jgi:hypothetical protein
LVADETFDIGGTRLADGARKILQWDLGPGHGLMSARAPDIPEGASHESPGIFSLAVTSYDDNKIATDYSRNDTPRDPMDLQHEFGDFNQYVAARHFIEMCKNPVPDDMFSLECLVEKPEVLEGEVGNLYFHQHFMV